jgi:hypothetical protein
MTDPDLSETVPEKLPVACPYNVGDTQSTTAHAIARKNSLLPITTPPRLLSDLSRDAQLAALRPCGIPYSPKPFKPSQSIAPLNSSDEWITTAHPKLQPEKTLRQVTSQPSLCQGGSSHRLCKHFAQMD